MKKTVWGVLLCMMLSGNMVSAVEKLAPYQDYLFIVVHGINDFRNSFIGESPEADAETNEKRNIRKLLEEYMGFPRGHVHIYSYTNARGSNLQNAKEFGMRGYVAPTKGDKGGYEFEKYGDHVGGVLRQVAGENRPEIRYSKDRKRNEYYAYQPALNDYFATGVEPGNSWLEQAREDWKIWYLDSEDNKDPFGERLIQNISDPRLDALAPKKHILLVHSMGGVSTRLYVYSNELSGPANNYFDRGFYEDDVSKIVFVGSPLEGSDMAWVLVCVGVPLS